MTDQGHNNPPSELELFASSLADLESKVTDALEVEITEASAGAIRDVIGLGKDLAKDVEKARKAAKQPFIDGGKDIDSAYNPIKADATTAIKPLIAKLEDWLREEKRKADEIRRAAEEKARAEAEAAAALADDPLVGDDVSASAKEAEAEARLAAAEAVARSSVKGTSGMRAMSMRKTRKVEVINANDLVVAYADHPDMITLAERLANADLRAKENAHITNIPGCRIVEQEALV